MTNPIKIDIQKAVHSVEPSPDFSKHLWEQIYTTPYPSVIHRTNTRGLWIPALAVVTIALVFILVAPQNVLGAFRSLTAYLPGIGFVHNDTNTLYLPEPVIMEQDGITLTIEQVVADAEKTVVSYRIEGLPTTELDKISPCFYDNNRLLLPDGDLWLPTGGGVENHQARIEFFPLPDNVSQATLIASMSFPDPACTAPQELRAEFSLGSAPPEIELKQVFENREITPSPEDLQEKTSATFSSESIGPAVQLIIDKVAVLDDGYLLLGHSEWTEKDWQNVIVDMGKVYAVDAAGKTLRLEPSNESNKDNAFAFKVLGKDFTAPVTIYVQNILVWSNSEDSSGFSFAADSNPQVGQNWDVNETLEIAGQKITIHSVRVVREISGMSPDKPIYGYAIEYSSDANTDGFIGCAGEGEASGSWGQIMKDGKRTVLETYYTDGLPFGNVTCCFQRLQFEVPGDWQIEWQPPTDVK